MAIKKLVPKSYSDFTVANLREMFGLKDKKQALHLEGTEVPISGWLETTLEMQRDLPVGTEKAKSELIITPVLLELRSKNKTKFTFFSGYTFEVDKEKALTGRCDYLLIKDAQSVDIEAPIIGIFEAKDDSIDRWVGQCGAEMYAARLFNQQTNTHIETIYGAVTNGYEWLFLKLEEDTLYIDTARYSIENPNKLLAALQKMIDFYYVI